jgi:hypothetical protein
LTRVVRVFFDDNYPTRPGLSSSFALPPGPAPRSAIALAKLAIEFQFDRG